MFAYLLNDETTPKLNRDRLRFSRSASAHCRRKFIGSLKSDLIFQLLKPWGLQKQGHKSCQTSATSPTKNWISGIGFGNEIAIADPDLNLLGPNIEGEILVRGNNVMKEYLDRPEETQKTITPDGWLRTGDLGGWMKTGSFLSLAD